MRTKLFAAVVALAVGAPLLGGCVVRERAYAHPVYYRTYPRYHRYVRVVRVGSADLPQGPNDSVAADPETDGATETDHL